ncbi:multicopper oxidase domain-containing protein [Methyloraptor flagellatus]|uniref:Multicopper oxidase CueO n=1 Tax=Methyloraptor flagellatus TaxID=3162530 RepID=A0AAU7XCH8_9HYPH
MTLSRRSLLLGSAAALFALVESAEARSKRRRSGGRKASRGKASRAAAASAPQTPPPPNGTALPIPELITVAADGETTIAAGFADHAFIKDKPARVAGYNGRHLGPALRLVRGQSATIRIENKLDRPTNVHWHGLSVDAKLDGAMQPPLAPGASATYKITADQSSATLWYHAHVHGSVGRDVHDGLAGFLIVEDPDEIGLGLPSTWGVDDIPLLIQDKDFDAAGAPVYAPDADAIEHGFRGRTVLVNGVREAVARVPQRPVRFRLLNASSARTYRLYCEDERGFDLIATDGGYLPGPVEITMLVLAPGERAEILIDFSLGSTNLMSTPDVHEHRMGATAMSLPDVIDKPFRVCGFDPFSDNRPGTKRPDRLVVLPPADPKTAVRRRRFELKSLAATAMPYAAGDHAAMDHTTMDHAAMGHAGHGQTTAQPTSRTTSGASDGAPRPALGINGKAFAMGRIDEEVGLGTTEIWEIVSAEMAHPFHVHGVQFRVLGEDGGPPKTWNSGLKDTVLVENSAELLITFPHRADRSAPFVYHCHVLEHEDAGMMGTFTVS